MWYGNFPILKGMYLNFREYGILDNYFYMLPILLSFFILRYALIFYCEKIWVVIQCSENKYMKVSLHDQPMQVKMIINEVLHKNVSQSSNDNSLFSSSDSLNSPLLDGNSMNANIEFHDMHNYFSDDSEDLILRRRRSSVNMSREGFSQNTPMLPQVWAQELEAKHMAQKQQKHELHQKIRWCKLLLKISIILKWCIILMVCVLFLPLSMYSIINAEWVVLISFAILMAFYIDQIYSEHKFLLLDININYDDENGGIVIPHVANPNKFDLVSLWKTIVYYLTEKPIAFIFGFTLIVICSCLFPFISANLCVGVYDRSEGIVFNM